METTINIRNDVLRMITLGARSKGISGSEMAVRLLKRVMNDVSNPGRMGKMVQYQKRIKQKERHTFHLYVREDDYEYFLDLRKLMKMSVSLLLAYAVEKYLDMILKGENTDNNRYRNYTIIKDIIDEIVCWRFIWGFPPNLEKLMRM